MIQGVVYFLNRANDHVFELCKLRSEWQSSEQRLDFTKIFGLEFVSKSNTSTMTISSQNPLSCPNCFLWIPYISSNSTTSACKG